MLQSTDIELKLLQSQLRDQKVLDSMLQHP